jgi:uncharacterized protein YdaU (DUF1376 family)
MQKLPWMPVFIDRFISDRKVQVMDLETFAAYILLLFSEWTDGPIPNNMKIIRCIAKGIDESKAQALLDDCFTLGENGWVNDTLEEIKKDQEQKHFKRVEAGRMGGKSKSTNKLSDDNEVHKQCSGNAKAMPKHKEVEVEVEVDKDKEIDQEQDQEQLHSSSRCRAPTLEEVKAYFIEQGTTIDPEQFWAHYEASGWMRGNTKIKKWKQCLKTWEQREKENGKSGGTGRRIADRLPANCTAGSGKPGKYAGIGKTITVSNLQDSIPGEVGTMPGLQAENRQEPARSEHGGGGA